ncbi:MAG: HAD family phosphatase [Planctomycetes bacterium]|nr:HAD family phosphatase [Planctomycetota bacterium]
MFEAILWDMDGTIVDTERVVWEVMQRAFLDAVQIELPEALFESLLGQSELDFYRHMVEKFSLTEADVQAIKLAFDRDYIPMLADVPPLPGALEKVADFADRAPQALVTGSTNAQARAVLDALDLAGHFRHVVACDLYSKGKPDPEPFLLAAQKLGVDPSSCLVLEDSPSGVTAAKKAGMKVVGIHEGNKGKYDIKHADLEVASLLDLEWDLLLSRFAGA